MEGGLGRRRGRGCGLDGGEGKERGRKGNGRERGEDNEDGSCGRIGYGWS